MIRAPFMGAALLMLAACAPSVTTSSDVPLDPGALIDVAVLEWVNDGVTATAQVELTNTGSVYSQFIVDTAVTDVTGEQILAYGPVVITAPNGGAPVTGTATLEGPFPVDAKLGVANLWGRVPGDEQIHTIALTEASDEVHTDGPLLAGDQVFTTAQEFASRLGAVQSDCRDDREVSGLICLSRRNTEVVLLPEEAQGRARLVPYFSQRDAVDGPPRAFEMVGADGQACIGQRIDKQTSAMVAISGSCSQRGLFPGFGGVVGLVDPVSVGAAARTSRPEWTASAAPVPTTEVRLTDVGRVISLGDVDITVDGVRIDLKTLGQPPDEVTANGSFTVVDVILTNPTQQQVDTRQWQLVIRDVQGRELPLDPTAGAVEASSALGPLAPGGTVRLLLVADVPPGQTAATLMATDTATGRSVPIRLLPPPS